VPNRAILAPATAGVVVPFGYIRAMGTHGVNDGGVVHAIIRFRGIALVLGVGAASLAIRWAVPIHAFPGAALDDQLFADQAYSILHGSWLGSFDGLRTLSKGPGLAMFFASTHLIHLPVQLALQGLHLAAAGYLATLVSYLSRRRSLGYVIFVAMAFDPTFFGGGDASRLVRENFYASLVALVLAAIGHLALCTRPPGIRGWLQRCGHATVLGVSFAMYWVTREERPWIALSLVVFALAWVMRVVRVRKTVRRVALIRWAAVLLVVVACFGGIVGGVVLQNNASYGVALTNDMVEGSFPKAVREMSRVRVGRNPHYVPISKAELNAIFAVSPTAEKIADEVRSEARTHWSVTTCQSIKVCTGDVGGGWMPWLLRGSLSVTGVAPTAPDVQRFWSAVAHEVSVACASGALTCRSEPVSLLPQTDLIDLRRLWHSTVAGFDEVFRFRQASPSPRVTPYSAAAAASWQHFTGGIGGLPSTLAKQVAIEQGYHSSRSVVPLLQFLYASPLLTLFALLGLVWQLSRRKHKALVVVCAVLLLTIVVRILFLALVDATSFTASRTGYQLAAEGLVAPFVATGIWLLSDAIRDRYFRDHYAVASADVVVPRSATHHLVMDFVKYAFNGAIAVSIYALVTWGMLSGTNHTLWLSVAVAYAVTATYNYVSTRFIFEPTTPFAEHLGKYIAVVVAGFVLTTLLGWYLGGTSVPHSIGAAIPVLVVPIPTFLALRHWVFA
jgi:hypothetical protein